MMLATKAKLSALVIMLLIPLAACKPNYSTYEDCILGNVKANQTREAVIAIRQACREKFPIKQNQMPRANAQAAADAAALAADPAPSNLRPDP